MRLVLAQKQLEEMPQAESLGLLHDETSKYGKKYERFHAADQDGCLYALGLRDISKSGQNVLNPFRQILHDIEAVSEDSDNNTSRVIHENLINHA